MSVRGRCGAEKIPGLCEATHNPHGTASAASGHARLGYAGGSRRSPEPTEVSDLKMTRFFNCQFLTRSRWNRCHVWEREDGSHQSHIPPWLLEVLGERTVIVANVVMVNYSVRMPVGNDVTMASIMMMAEDKT